MSMYFRYRCCSKRSNTPQVHPKKHYRRGTVSGSPVNQTQLTDIILLCIGLKKIRSSEIKNNKGCHGGTMPVCAVHFVSRRCGRRIHTLQWMSRETRPVLYGTIGVCSSQAGSCSPPPMVMAVNRSPIVKVLPPGTGRARLLLTWDVRE